MSDTLHLNPSRALDINGLAVPGALAYFYNSGTSTLRRVYADAAGATPLPQPVQANGAGLFPMIFDLAAGDAKVVVTTPEGAMLPGYPLDPAPRSSVGDTGARGIVFAATDDIPVTNVQAAIERVQDNIVAPLADFGLGVTGNAVLVNDLDSPTRASGFYRYDGTTAGTFPADVVAADGGVLSIWRQTSSRLLQQLSPITGGRVWQRVHDGAWGPWRWLLTSADTVDDATWRAGVSTVPAAVTPAAMRAGVAALALGEGQEWQDVTASRTHSTAYTNDTGRTISVAIFGARSVGGDRHIQVTDSSGAWVPVGIVVGDGRQAQVFEVPAGRDYRINGAATVIFWSELR